MESAKLPTVSVAQWVKPQGYGAHCLPSHQAADVRISNPSGLLVYAG